MMVVFKPWFSAEHKTGEVYAVDPETKIKLAQALFFITHKQAEVRGVCNHSLSRDDMLRFERYLCDQMRFHGVVYAWGVCASDRGDHYERTYSGWKVVGLAEDPSFCQVEKHL